MAGIELIRQFLQQAQAQGSKSTALNPLGWLLAILLSGLLGSLWVQAPSWIISALAICAAFVVVGYLFAYGYFMFRNPDALRSERFTLSKMAIERSITGDNLTGLIETEEVVIPTTTPALPDPSNSADKDGGN